MDKLEDFKEGQWWVKELDAMAQAETATPDQKRAVAVVHNMLRVARSYLGVKTVGTVEFPVQLWPHRYVAFHEVGKPAHEVSCVAMVLNKIGESKWLCQGLSLDTPIQFDAFTGLSDSGLLQLCWASGRSEENTLLMLPKDVIIDRVAKHLEQHAATQTENQTLKETHGNNT